MPQETCPCNCQIKYPSVCQSVLHGPIQLNSKERVHIKFQSNYQVPRQWPHQLIIQIDSSRYTRVFPREMPSITTFSQGFGESSGDPSGRPSDKPTKDTPPIPIIKPASVTSETSTKYPFRVPK